MDEATFRRQCEDALHHTAETPTCRSSVALLSGSTNQRGAVAARDRLSSNSNSMFTQRSELPSVGQRDFLKLRLAEAISINQRLKEQLVKELPHRADSEFADTAIEEKLMECCFDPVPTSTACAEKPHVGAAEAPTPTAAPTSVAGTSAAANVAVASAESQTTLSYAQTHASLSSSANVAEDEDETQSDPTPKRTNLLISQDMASKADVGFIASRILLMNELDCVGRRSAKRRVKDLPLVKEKVRIRIVKAATELELIEGDDTTSLQLGNLLFAHLGQHTQAFSTASSILRAEKPHTGKLSKYFGSMDQLSQEYYRSMSLLFVTTGSEGLPEETAVQTIRTLLGIDNPSPKEVYDQITAQKNKTNFLRLNLVFKTDQAFDIVACLLDAAKPGLPCFPVPVDFSTLGPKSAALQMMKSTEIQFCQRHHIPPHAFLAAKKQLFGCGLRCLDANAFKKTVDLDMLRTSKLLLYFSEAGWIRLHEIYRVEDGATTAAMSTFY